jgi:tetratricopeptide (TPR) repeat protein
VQYQFPTKLNAIILGTQQLAKVHTTHHYRNTKHMVSPLRRISRRFSTGTSNTIANTSSSRTVKTLLNDGNSSISNRNRNRNKNNNNEEDNLNNKSHRRSSSRRYRRHTMDHQIHDESTAVSSLQSATTTATATTTINNDDGNTEKVDQGTSLVMNNDYDENGDPIALTTSSSHLHRLHRNSTGHLTTYSNHSTNNDSSSIILASSSPSGSSSSPTKTATPNSTSTKKTRASKQRRRSSFAKAASSVLATSRNWLSTPSRSRSRSSSIGSNSNSSCSSSSNHSNNNNMPVTSSFLEQSTNKNGCDDRNVMQQRWYASEQARLHALAEEMHRDENLGQAIEYWEQSLELAGKNTKYSNLSEKTKVLCMLMDLHFQESQRLQLEEREYPKQQQQQQESSTIDIMPFSMSRCDGSSSSINSSILSLSLEEAIMPSFQSQEKQKQQYSSSNNSSLDFHKRKAKRMAHRIKSVLVQPTWLRRDVSFMEFLCDAKAWELALIVANKLMGGEESSSDGEQGDDKDIHKRPSEVNSTVSPQRLATLHFNISSLRLHSHRQGEALQHFQATILCLKQVPIDQRDMTMYLQALQLVAAEYQQQGNSMLALQSYEEQRKHSPSEQHARISCQMAEVYISEGQLELAIKELESAHDLHHSNSNNNNDDNDNDDNDDDDQATGKATISAIRLQLLQTKGDVYSRLGRMDESMQVYQQALQETKNPAEEAKLLYIMGRLCIRMGRTRDAISCFTHELEITQRELGAHHLSVSVIYQSIAKIYEEISDYNMGIYYYNKALKIELSVMQDLHSVASSCSKCDTALSHRMCDVHVNIRSQLLGQIRETKKNLGRIHFKLGDFDGALKASLGNDQL